MSRSVRSSRLALVLAGLFTFGIASAAPKLPEREPGLWEIKIDRGQMSDMLKGIQDAMKDLPPEQRKMMQEMMAGSGMVPGQPVVIRECLTPEMARREPELKVDDTDMKCSDPEWGGSSTDANYTMSCTNAEGKWKVEGRVWDASPKRFKGAVKMSGTVNGQPVNTMVSHEARWVGADCQGVKPLQ